jgi:plastocyanin
MRWLGGVALVVVGAVLLAVPVLGANQSVTATTNLQFSPKVVTVTQGEAVTWTNAGGAHNVKFDDGSFTQPDPANGTAWTVTRTFNTPGKFLYYCAVHGNVGGVGMAGSVVVEAKSTQQPGSGTNPVTSSPTVGIQGQPESTPCKSQRNFRIRIRQPKGVRIASAQVSVNGRPVEVSKLVIDGRLRHIAEVDLRGLGKGTYKVDIVAKTDKGKELRGTRSYQTCAAKLTSSALPAL